MTTAKTPRRPHQRTKASAAPRAGASRRGAARVSREQILNVASEWRTTVDTTRETMMMIGPDGRIARANRATQDLFSLPFSQLVGARADDVARPLLGGSDPLRLARTRKSGRPFHGEVRAGDDRWFALAVDPIAADGGGWHGAVCRLRDISERRRADLRMRRALREVRHLAAHLQESREEERTSIAQQIHERLLHDMTALKLDLSWLREQVAASDAEIARRVAAMTELADRCLKTLRRISSDLRPDLLDHFGPAEAIEWQAEELHLKTGVRTRLDLRAGALELSNTTSTALFRIVEAALENVARHAGATQVAISLHRENSHVVVAITDDGRGFDPRKVATGSVGLVAMRERARSLGGEVSIESRLRRGTTVTARLPID